MRYFLELSYIGSRYAGFQIQENAASVQAEVEKALLVLYKTSIALTGSSRTDAGVHARQNFFHFDTDLPIRERQRYNLNALLPNDIAIRNIHSVSADAHSRFDATSRRYEYHIYDYKDPFLQNRAFYYPYQLDLSKLNEAAAALMEYTDFTTFSKRNTQTRTNLCTLTQSHWQQANGQLVYTVEANRFLRGMVKGLVGTMLRVSRGKLSMNAFRSAIAAKDCSKADFGVAAHGLFLMQVNYPPDYFKTAI